MEKSINNIWQKGFLHEDALIAPQVNNLYDRKSNDIIDKYKRMFRNNIKAIIIGSVVLLFLSFIIKMPYMGVPMFILLNIMAIIDKKLLSKLEQIDKGISSYEYLKSVEAWILHKNKVNIFMARILYPFAFFSMLLGLWFIPLNQTTVGSTLLDMFLAEFPETYLILDFPVSIALVIISIMSLLAFMGHRLYKADINIVYGPVLKKIQELIADMEELREELV